MDQGYISNSLMVSLIRFADQRNIDVLDWVNEMGIDILDESTPVPFHSFSRIMEHLVDKTGDNDLGVHLGEQYNIAALGIVGQLVQVSSSLDEALQNSIAYFNVMSNVIQIEMEMGNTVKIFFRFRKESLKEHPLTCYHLVMSSLVFSYREIFYLTLKKITPLEVGIAFESQNTEKLAEILRCRVKMGSGSNYIEFERAALTAKIRFANYELYSVLEKVVCDQLKQYTDFNQALAVKIKGVIYALLDPGIPSFGKVAENMHMSERSLQRHLKQEGTNYSLLVREVRQELSIAYLKQNRSTSEISYLLGYSEPSSFVNAFRLWFNTSPGQYRKNTLSKTI